MALNMNPDVFEGFVADKLDDKNTEIFVDFLKVLLKTDNNTTIQDILNGLETAKDNFDTNYKLVKTALEAV